MSTATASSLRSDRHHRRLIVRGRWQVRTTGLFVSRVIALPTGNLHQLTGVLVRLSHNPSPSYRRLSLSLSLLSPHIDGKGSEKGTTLGDLIATSNHMKRPTAKHMATISRTILLSSNSLRPTHLQICCNENTQVDTEMVAQLKQIHTP